MGKNGFRYGAVIGVLATMALVAAACVPPPISRPPSGEPGSAGPCSFVETHITNPVDWRHDLVVLEPTGKGSPYTGGSCAGADRPTVFISHGYTGNIVEGYRGLVNHLVSNGFVVVFPGYTAEYGADYTHNHQYRVVDSGYQLAAKQFSHRMDLSRIGLIGHSFGAGMLYWLAQQAEGRGWGTDSFWAVNFAPWFAMGVGTETIDLPDNMEFVMVNFQEDVFVDARIGNEQYKSLSLPDSQKKHMMIYSDHGGSPSIIADHIGPVSVEIVPGLSTIGTDHLDYWASFRTIDATAGCLLSKVFCDTDLTFTGLWPDGRPVKPAVFSHDQPDVGAIALQECDFFMNPRTCY